jgi:hypothetical protein
MGATASDLISHLEVVWPKVDKNGEGSIQRHLMNGLAQELITASKIQMSADLALSYSSPYLTGQKVTKDQIIDFISRETSVDMPSISSAAVRRQVEYYFSDENLAYDKFFNEKILENKEGFVPFDAVLKCQRLKNLKVTQEDLVQAVSTSELLDLDNEKGIRRRDNKAVPPLKVTKKGKSNKLPEQTVEILLVTFENDAKLTWKDLRDSFRSKFIEANVVYVRFHGNHGHVGVSADTQVDPIIAAGVEVNGQKGIISKLSGDQLLEFWKANGSHFDMCSQGNKKKGHFEKNKNINMGGKMFTSVTQLKNYVNSVLNGSAEGTVDPHYHNLLAAVFRLHPNFEEKGVGLKTFAIGKHPEHPESKCFFVVKEDGSLEDFSISKCLQQL